MSEKDKTIIDLMLEIADRSRTCEGQVTRLLWLAMGLRWLTPRLESGGKT